MNNWIADYTLESLTAEVPLAEYRRDCLDIPRFLAYCRECPDYEHNWSCPPYDFDAAELWQGYGGLRLYGRLLAFAPQTPAETALAALSREKQSLLMELLALEKAVPGSLALSAGNCQLCAPQACNRPHTPCLHPEGRRYSLESLGGNVDLTARRYLGKSLLWCKDGVAPDYLLLVGGLLLPAGEGG